MAEVYVSQARLQPYLAVCKNLEDALDLHSEAMLIGSTLLSLIAMIEIALRNRLHQQMGTDFGNKDWLTTDPCPVPLQPSEIDVRSKAVRQARMDRYSKLTNKEKRQLDLVAFPQGMPETIKHSTLSKRRQSVITLKEGEVVAHTTLFFWKRFFAPDFEPTIWKRSARKLFPNKTLSRSDVSVHVETLYRARNRLAHHEPMYGPRLNNAIAAAQFVRENLDCRFADPNGPLCRFTQNQYTTVVARKAEFDEAWRRLSKGEQQA